MILGSHIRRINQMDKDDLKSIMEYQYLKKRMITTIVIIVIWVGAVAINTIPFWFDSDMRIAVLGVILVVGIIVTMLYSSRILYCGIELINRGRNKYELVEATIAVSYLSRMYFTRYAKVLKCSAHLIKDNVIVDFNVYIDMYDNDIELKSGSVVLLMYNESNGSALFVSKK